MVKTAVIGALAPLLVLGTSARADWRSPIKGAEPILPSVFAPSSPPRPRLPMPGAAPMLPPHFVPRGDAVVAPVATPITVAPVSSEPVPPPPVVWSLPLVDRRLAPDERAADIAPELQDAVLRIEPMYDPTRIDGPDAEVPLQVSSGTAAMDNVFADHWRLATPDANINLKTSPIATAWQATGVLPCEAFFKNRPHTYGDPSLTALSQDDCRQLLRTEALRYDEAPPSPIVAAPISVPVFAAPLPGSRMSSDAFWAAQRARIQSIQSRLHDKWQAGRERVSEAGPHS